MQKLEQASVSVHSMIMLPRNEKGYRQVAVLPEDFDPKTQAVFLVDLEKDPQVWLEKYETNLYTYLHEKQPNNLGNGWSGDEPKEGYIIVEEDTKEEAAYVPNWIERNQVAHMVCIGFLKPEEEQSKQEPEHKEPNESMWNLPADWEVDRQKVINKYPQCFVFNKEGLLSDWAIYDSKENRNLLGVGHSIQEAWVDAAKGLEDSPINEIIQKHFNRIMEIVRGNNKVPESQWFSCEIGIGLATPAIGL